MKILCKRTFIKHCLNKSSFQYSGKFKRLMHHRACCMLPKSVLEHFYVLNLYRNNNKFRPLLNCNVYTRLYLILLTLESLIKFRSVIPFTFGRGTNNAYSLSD